MNQPMSVLTSQATVEWYSPSWIVDLARRLMGGIDLDPASSDIAQQTVRAERHYTSTDDGYGKPWNGRVFLNPPFDDTPRWVKRLAAAYEDGDVNQAILAVNSAPGYNWWEDLYRAYPVCLLRERVRFVRPDGTAAGACKKGTTIAYFGPLWQNFDQLWAPHGRVLWPSTAPHRTEARG